MAAPKIGALLRAWMAAQDGWRSMNPMPNKAIGEFGTIVGFSSGPSVLSSTTIMRNGKNCT